MKLIKDVIEYLDNMYNTTYDNKSSQYYNRNSFNDNKLLYKYCKMTYIVSTIQLDKENTLMFWINK